MIEIQQVFDICALRQDNHVRIPMPCEKGNHHSRIAAERFQSQSILKFAQVEGRWAIELGCNSIHFNKDFR